MLASSSLGVGTIPSVSGEKRSIIVFNNQSPHSQGVTVQLLRRRRSVDKGQPDVHVMVQRLVFGQASEEGVRYKQQSTGCRELWREVEGAELPTACSMGSRTVSMSQSGAQTTGSCQRSLCSRR